MDKAFSRLADLGGCGPENECIPPGWQAITGASGVTIMEDAGGRFLTHTNIVNPTDTQIVGGGQRYEDVEVKFSYRFRSDTQPAQSIEVMPMYARDQDGVELFTSLQVSPSGLMLRNRSVIGYNDPCTDGYCPNYDLNEESASYGSAYGVWYDVLMRMYGDDVFVWVKPAGEPLPWEVWTIYNEPVLVAEGFTEYNAAPKVFRVYFNTALGWNAGALQVKDLSIAAWHCPEEAPVLDNTPCGDVVISEIQSYNQSTYEYPENEFHPWIELWNRTGGNADISGWALTDDPAVPGKYVFPANTILTSEYSIVILPENSGHADFKGFTLDKDNGGFVALLCDKDTDNFVPFLSNTAVEYPALSTDYSFALMPGSESGFIKSDDFGIAQSASAGFASNWSYFTRIDWELDVERPNGLNLMPDPEDWSSNPHWITIDYDAQALDPLVQHASEIYQRDNTFDNINGTTITRLDVPCNVKVSIDRTFGLRVSNKYDSLIESGAEFRSVFVNSNARLVLVSEIIPNVNVPGAPTDETPAFTPHSKTRTRIIMATGMDGYNPVVLAHEFMHYVGLWGHYSTSVTGWEQELLGRRDPGGDPQIRVVMSDCQCKRLRSEWTRREIAGIVNAPGGNSIAYHYPDEPGARTLPANCDELKDGNGSSNAVPFFVPW